MEVTAAVRRNVKRRVMASLVIVTVVAVSVRIRNGGLVKMAAMSGKVIATPGFS